MTVSDTGGHAITQYDWYDSSPNFDHPFRGAEYPEFTASFVGRLTTAPTVSINRTAFNIQSFAMGFAEQPATSRYFITTNLEGDGGNISNEPMFLDSVANWDILHWYWIGVSYSQPLNKHWLSVVNFSTGTESTIAGTITNNIDVWWSSVINGSHSAVGWGGSSLATQSPDVQLSLWKGHLTQVYIDNAYYDFSVTANIRKFCGTDGVINLGLRGQVPAGATPLVYLPNGHPSSNVGTLNVGDYPSDFWLSGTEVYDEDQPPIAS